MIWCNYYVICDQTLSLVTSLNNGQELYSRKNVPTAFQKNPAHDALDG